MQERNLGKVLQTRYFKVSWISCELRLKKLNKFLHTCRVYIWNLDMW